MPLMTLGMQRKQTSESVQLRGSNVKAKESTMTKAVRARKESRMPRVLSQRMRLHLKEISPRMLPRGSVMVRLR